MYHRCKCFVVSLIMLSCFSLSAQAGPLVKTDERALVTDFDQDEVYEPFLIQGAGYSPVPIGRSGMQWGMTNLFDDESILRRDFQLLHDMHANTIRIWKADDTNNNFNEFPNFMTTRTLDIAQEYGLKVIPGFWIGFAGWWECQESGRVFVWDADFFDLENKTVRESVRTGILNRWQYFVQQFKGRPEILFWAIGNENNIQLGDDEDLVRAFYDLINDMAVLAHTIDPDHPVAFVNGGIELMVPDGSGGSKNIFGDDLAQDLDIWGMNVYQGEEFNDFFTDYAQMSQKPLWISEFGIDAWHSDRYDPQGGYEDQVAQAAWVGARWEQIIGHHDIAVGGTVMEYSDEWWKPYQWMCQKPGWEQWWRPYWEFYPDGSNYPCGVFNDSHDLYGIGPTDMNCDGVIEEGVDWFPSAPDAFFNEEWWGIMSIQKNLIDGEPDEMTPRLVYGVLQEKFLKGLNNPPVMDEIADQTTLSGQTLQILITATDPDQETLTFQLVRDNGEEASALGVQVLDNGDGSWMFEWTPSGENAGQVYSFVATVTDSSSVSDDEVFSVTVEWGPPVITDVAPGSGKAGDAVVITGENFGPYQADENYDALCDMTHDGVVDLADFSLLYASYGRSVGDSQFNPIADVTQDGVVNFDDFAVFVDAYPSSAHGSYVAFDPMAGPSARIVSWSDTQIQCIVPPLAQTGVLGVHTPGGQSDGSFTLEGQGQDQGLSIESLSPETGSPGQQVIIKGSGFGMYDGSLDYNPAMDFDQDGDVDRPDFNFLYGAYRTQEGDVKYQAAADLNHDGFVNFSDFALFLDAYGESRGKKYVSFGGVEANILSWNDGQIICEVPFLAETGEVQVFLESEVSNGIVFTIP